MRIKDVLIWIGAVLVAIWLVGLFIKLASWLLNATVIVGGVFIIAWVIVQFVDSKRANN